MTPPKQNTLRFRAIALFSFWNKGIDRLRRLWEVGDKRYYCSYDDYNISGCCKIDKNTKTWHHLAEFKRTLPEAFEIPNLDITVAVLAPVTERLKRMAR